MFVRYTVHRRRYGHRLTRVLRGHCSVFCGCHQTVQQSKNPTHVVTYQKYTSNSESNTTVRCSRQSLTSNQMENCYFRSWKRIPQNAQEETIWQCYYVSMNTLIRRGSSISASFTSRQTFDMALWLSWRQEIQANDKTNMINISGWGGGQISELEKMLSLKDFSPCRILNVSLYSANGMIVNYDRPLWTAILFFPSTSRIFPSNSRGGRVLFL